MKQLFKVLLVSITAFSLAGSKPLCAQTFEEYRKKEADNFRKFKQEESAYLEKMRKEYQDYVAERDKEFADFLKKEWKPYPVEEGKKIPEKPKPPVIPEYKPIEGSPKPEPKLIPVKPVVPAPNQVPALVPFPEPPIRKPDSTLLTGVPASLFFYGVPVYLEYDKNFRVNIPSQADRAGIAIDWEKASGTNYSSLVKQLLDQKQKMNLNDYCYYLLVKKYAEALYPENENGQILAAWFLLIRSGYGVRLATEQNTFILLLPSRNIIYSKMYLTEDGQKYYIMSKTRGGQLSTYDKDYPGASHSIDFNISSPMALGHKVSTKNLTFDYLGKTQQIMVTYDQGLVDLYKDYPQLEMPVYFNASISLQAKESIAASLKPVLAGMTDLQAANFLLSFVQNAFNYKTDPEQFGREKFFFAEEVFFYPFSDCEDRSVLFSYLVRELLGLNVIGIEYPEHIATAIEFPDQVPGDYIINGKARYVVSDPTYIGAPVGSTMPNYKSVSPYIIPIENIRVADIRNNSQWSVAQKGGCYPANNMHNLVNLIDGSSVLTGYYTGAANFAGKALPVSEKVNACFVGKLTSEGKPVWVNTLTSTGNTIGVSTTANSSGNIFLAGSFRGKLLAGSLTLDTKGEGPDAFVASYSSTGELRWIKNVSFDSIPNGAPIAFSAIFTTEGKFIDLILTDVYDDFKDYGLFTDGTGKLVYNGIMNRVFAATPSIKTAEFASSAFATSLELLTNETDALIADGANRGIAGLLSAIYLVRDMGVTLSGNDAQEAIDKYNPEFKNESPNIFENIGKINFVKNSNGIITIMTENGDDILFDKIKVMNTSNICVSSLPSGNLQFDILSGISVGKMFIWYDLNFIRLFRSSGDILFDYDSDHSQKTVNILVDILN